MAGILQLETLSVRLVADASNFNIALQKAEKQVMYSATRLSSLASKMGQAAILPFTILTGIAIQQMMKFDQAMVHTMTVMEGVDETTRKKLEESIFAISSKSITAPTALAEAHGILAKAGLGTQESIATLTEIERYAVATVTDLHKATSDLVDIQTALGMRSNDAAMNLSYLANITDILAKGSTLANVTAQELADSLRGKLSGTIRMLGMDLEDTTAALAVFASMGVKGKEGGTYLDTMLKKLMTSVIKNGQVWEALNISALDSMGGMKPLADIIRQLEVRFEGATAEQRRMEMGMLGFDDKSLKAINMLIGMSGALTTYREQLNQAGGSVDDMAKRQLNSFSAQLKILWNNLNIVLITVAQQFVPVMLMMNNAIRGAVDWWMNLDSGIKHTILVFAGAVAGFTFLGIALKALSVIAALIVSPLLMVASVLTTITGVVLGVVRSFIALSIVPLTVLTFAIRGVTLALALMLAPIQTMQFVASIGSVALAFARLRYAVVMVFNPVWQLMRAFYGLGLVGIAAIVMVANAFMYTQGWIVSRVSAIVTAFTWMFGVVLSSGTVFRLLGTAAATSFWGVISGFQAVGSTIGITSRWIYGVIGSTLSGMGAMYNSFVRIASYAIVGALLFLPQMMSGIAATVFVLQSRIASVFTTISSISQSFMGMVGVVVSGAMIISMALFASVGRVAVATLGWTTGIRSLLTPLISFASMVIAPIIPMFALLGTTIQSMVGSVLFGVNFLIAGTLSGMVGVTQSVMRAISGITSVGELIVTVVSRAMMYSIIAVANFGSVIGMIATNALFGFNFLVANSLAGIVFVFSTTARIIQTVWSAMIATLTIPLTIPKITFAVNFLIANTLVGIIATVRFVTAGIVSAFSSITPVVSGIFFGINFLIANSLVGVVRSFQGAFFVIGKIVSGIVVAFTATTQAISAIWSVMVLTLRIPTITFGINFLIANTLVGLIRTVQFVVSGIIASFQSIGGAISIIFNGILITTMLPLVGMVKIAQFAAQGIVAAFTGIRSVIVVAFAGVDIVAMSITLLSSAILSMISVTTGISTAFRSVLFGINFVIANTLVGFVRVGQFIGQTVASAVVGVLAVTTYLTANFTFLMASLIPAVSRIWYRIGSIIVDAMLVAAFVVADVVMGIVSIFSVAGRAIATIWRVMTSSLIVQNIMTGIWFVVTSTVSGIWSVTQTAFTGITTLLKGITPVFEKVMNWVADIVDNIVYAVVAGVKALVMGLLVGIKNLIIGIIPFLLNIVVWFAALIAIASVVGTAIAGIVQVFQSLGGTWDKMKNAIPNLFAGAAEQMNNFGNGAVATWGRIKIAMATYFEAFAQFMSKVGGFFWNFGENATRVWLFLVDNWREVAYDIGNIAVAMVENIVRNIITLGSLIISIGKTAWQGFWGIVTNYASLAFEALKVNWKGALDDMGSVFQTLMINLAMNFGAAFTAMAKIAKVNLFSRSFEDIDADIAKLNAQLKRAIPGEVANIVPKILKLKGERWDREDAEKDIIKNIKFRGPLEGLETTKLTGLTNLFNGLSMRMRWATDDAKKLFDTMKKGFSENWSEAVKKFKPLLDGLDLGEGDSFLKEMQKFSKGFTTEVSSLYGGLPDLAASTAEKFKTVFDKLDLGKDNSFLKEMQKVSKIFSTPAEVKEKGKSSIPEEFFRQLGGIPNVLRPLGGMIEGMGDIPGELGGLQKIFKPLIGMMGGVGDFLGSKEMDKLMGSPGKYAKLFESLNLAMPDNAGRKILEMASRMLNPKADMEIGDIQGRPRPGDTFKQINLERFQLEGPGGLSRGADKLMEVNDKATQKKLDDLIRATNRAKPITEK